MPARCGEFDVLQLVRLWQRNPEAKLRFRADLDAAHPARPISRAELIAPDTLQISTADFCVASEIGPLPEPFLEWVRALDRAGQGAMRAFLDLFNHRINLLRHRMRGELELGLSNRSPDRSELAEQLAALMGLPGMQAAPRLKLPLRSWLGIGGLLADARRTAAGLTQVLSAHLGCPVQLQPMVGAWSPIEAGDRPALGRARLGHDSLVGTQVWSPQAAVRLRIGPMPFSLAQRLLPPARAPSASRESGAEDPGDEPAAAAPDHGAEATRTSALHAALASLVHGMLDRRHDAHVQLLVRADTLPLAHLVAKPQTAAGSAARPGLRLGQTAWLNSRAARAPALIRFVIRAYESLDAPPSGGAAAPALS